MPMIREEEDMDGERGVSEEQEREKRRK